MGNGERVGIPWPARFMAFQLMLITPEYWRLRRLRGNKGNDGPSLQRLPVLPILTKDIGGVQIRYAHQENPGKPAVILLSPFPLSLLSFAGIWDRLARDHDLYAVDLPGFGGSEGGPEHMTFVGQGAFLAEFIAALGISKPHIVGADVGLPAALMLALEHPELVASVMVGDGPAVSPSSNGSIIEKMVKSPFWRSVIRASGSAALVDGTKRLAYRSYVPCPKEVSDYVNSYRGRVGLVTQWFKNYPASLASLSPRLSQIAVPVVVFWGDSDMLLMVENARRLSDAVPGSRLRVLTDCGHMPHQDKPDEFVELVQQWVAEHER